MFSKRWFQLVIWISAVSVIGFQSPAKADVYLYGKIDYQRKKKYQYLNVMADVTDVTYNDPSLREHFGKELIKELEFLFKNNLILTESSRHTTLLLSLGRLYEDLITLPFLVVLPNIKKFYDEEQPMVLFEDLEIISVVAKKVDPKVSLVGLTKDCQVVLRIAKDLTKDKQDEVLQELREKGYEDFFFSLVNPSSNILNGKIKELIVVYKKPEYLPQSFEKKGTPLEGIKGLTIDRWHRPGRFVVVRLEGKWKCDEDLIQTLRCKNIEIEYKIQFVEPNYQLCRETSSTRRPNDKHYTKGHLWGLEHINAPWAWAAWLNMGEVPCSQKIVAVLDSGVDYRHKDLRIWTNSDEICNDGVDNDSNGYKDDIHGYDFYNDKANPMDNHGHGTLCAGVIGACGDNEIGVVGVNWGVEIMAVQVFGYNDCSAKADKIAEAIDYAVCNGAKVLNCSWGGCAYSWVIHDALRRANYNDCLIVAAAGNGRQDNVDKQEIYPACYDMPDVCIPENGSEEPENDRIEPGNILSVLSVDPSDKMSRLSNYGPNHVDLGAPGRSILSTDLYNKYSAASGTSMATAFVSGAAALVWQRLEEDNNSKVRPKDVKKALIENVRPCGDLTEKCISDGVLDIGFLNKQTPTQIDVEYAGLLRHPVCAPGGETTGTELKAKNKTYELDLGQDLMDKVEELNGQHVLVKGKLSSRRGVAKRKIRWIIKVESIEND